MTPEESVGTATAVLFVGTATAVLFVNKGRKGPSACCAPVGLVLTRALSSRRKVFNFLVGHEGPKL
jgi:hypothetical protein